MTLVSSIRLAALAAAALLCCALPSSGAPDSDPEPAEQAQDPGAPRAVPIEDVADEAQYVSQRLRSFAPSGRTTELTESSETERERLVRQIRPRLGRSRTAHASRPAVHVVGVLDAELAALQRLLEAHQEILDDQARTLVGALQELDQMHASWAATREAAGPATTPEPVLRRIDSTIEAIESTSAELRTRRDAVLTLLDRFVEEQEAVDGTLDSLEGEIDARLSQLFWADRVPLWEADFRAALRRGLRERPVRADAEALTAYLRAHAPLLGVQILALCALGLLFRILAARLRARLSRYPDLAEVARTWELPYSMALLLTVAVSEFSSPLHPLAPPLYSVLLLSLFAVVPVLRIARRNLPAPLGGAAIGFLALFVADRVHFLLTPIEAVARGFYALELVGAVAFFSWLQRACGQDGDARIRLTRIVARFALVLFGVALVAEVGGWSQLATVTGVGTQRAAFRALSVYALLKVAQALAGYALTSRFSQRLNAVRGHRLLVRDRLFTVLGWLALALWLYVTLAAYGLTGPGLALLQSILASGISVGALSLTVGDLAAFALTLLAALWLARLVEFALGEEVYPRVQLPRGIPYALSALARYSLLLVGFLFALAAAGIEIGRLTILAGGLGVGIGFGLQNVTNNFISGLILLFERPVQVGDMVELQSQLVGYIRRIGIRATLLETLDGAEVIVPNGQLISELVTNWTLSHTYRRIDLSVGVVYGTSAPRVIELLLDAARSCEDVREDPAPQAFFVGFGDSALEFLVRVWAPRYEHEYPVRSQLAVAVQGALEQAGIEVPFPQRDLHLKSIATELRPPLADRAGPEQAPPPPAPARAPADST